MPKIPMPDMKCPTIWCGEQRDYFELTFGSRLNCSTFFLA